MMENRARGDRFADHSEGLASRLRESTTGHTNQENAVVHIVDHDAHSRIALSRLLRSVGYDTNLYASADEFIEAERPDNSGCVVTDVRLPGRSGLDLQHYLSGLRNSPPVILMTGVPDVQMSVKCMKAGAIDFLTKPIRDQEVLDAVAEALESDRKRRATASIVLALESRFERLSPRERQVMALVTTGKMNKQVATALALSEITVKIHRGSVMKKMAAASLADLVRMAQVLEPQLQLA
jgi:FixJ family two-component response regulator